MFAVLILSVTFRCCCCCWKSITIDNRLNATLEKKSFPLFFLLLLFYLCHLSYCVLPSGFPRITATIKHSQMDGVCVCLLLLLLLPRECVRFFCCCAVVETIRSTFQKVKNRTVCYFQTCLFAVVLASSSSFSLSPASPFLNIRLCVCVYFEADEPVMYACCVVPKRKEKNIKDDYGQMGRKTSKRRQSAPIYERVWWKEKANQKVRLNLRTVKHTHITFI